MASTCAVCERPPESGAGLNRVGGADVCDPCYLGAAPQRVRERGWNLKIRQFERVVNSDGDRVYISEATLRAPFPAQVHFKCRRKTLGWRLLGLVMRGPKSGDDLFDGHVHVTSKNPRAATALLGDEGVQSILLDMLGEGSWILVQRGTIEVYSCRQEYVPDAQFSSEMCVLASHFVRLQG